MSGVLSRYMQRGISAERRWRGLVASKPPFDLGSLLSPAQASRAFHPARFKALPAGRQSGKTDLEEKLMLAKASDLARRGQQVIYVSTSIRRAVATIWDELVQLNADLGIGGSPNHTTHEIRYPRAGKLRVHGCETKAEADAVRGLKKVCAYFIDEAQDWKDDLLRYFFDKVVYPSLVAVSGEVYISGTGCAPHGFWYEVATGKPGRNGKCAGESFHRFGPWTPYDNPFLPPGEVAKLIEQACRDRGCDLSDPSIRTEFFAEFVADLNRQIFQFERERNGFTRGSWDTRANWWSGADLPKGRWSVIIASDVGSVDAYAYSVIGKCDSDPNLWILETDSVKSLGAAAQVQAAKEVRQKYGARVVKTVMDPGGGGKGLIIDLNQEHHQGIEAAEKQNKAAACIIMRSGLRTGKLKIALEESEFISDLAIPEWDPDAVGSVIKNHFPDRCDAALYGYREAALMFHGVKVVPKDAHLTPYEKEVRRDSWS